MARMIAKNDSRMVQGIKRLVHEDIGMPWRERYDNEEHARAVLDVARRQELALQQLHDHGRLGTVEAAGIAAQAKARAYREVRTRFPGCDAAMLAQAQSQFGVVSPFGGPTSSGMLTLHCPPEQVYALTSSQLLRETLDLFVTRDAAEAELREILEGEPQWVNVLRVVPIELDEREVSAN